MHGAADKLFAGSGFAVDENSAVGGGHELDLLAKGLHGDGLAGDGAASELAGELLVVLAHLAGAHGVLDHDERAVEGERFLEEVVCAELGGAGRGFDGAVTADDDDLGDVGAVEGADLGEGVEAVAVGEPDVEQDDVVGGVAQESKGLGGGGGGGDEVILFAEDGLERLADLGFVVDDEDVVSFGGGGLRADGCRLGFFEGGFEFGHGVVGATAARGLLGCVEVWSLSAAVAGRSSTMKRAPAGSFFSARMVPPCSWMILAAMARPRPVPRCLVEKYGRNRRSTHLVGEGRCRSRLR